MRKELAVAALGQQSLLMPAWIKAALAANDRLKLYLTMLQAASMHAVTPESAIADFRGDLAQAGLRDAKWLQQLVKTAYLDDRGLVLPELPSLLKALRVDLGIMARPVCDGADAGQPDLAGRRDNWMQRLERLQDGEELSPEALADLTRGERKGADSLHLLVMDLHKQLNALSGELATEQIAGAHVWQIEDDDRPLIEAFMRGLNRTAPLKFSHPGLDTAVTRDGERLLIQNDIGTNDVHVLVIEVAHKAIKLTYSDLHLSRFGFFRQLLEAEGFKWTVTSNRSAEGLNDGRAYQLGSATLVTHGRKSLLERLEALASRIVFVIDWNRARKRLQGFVSKARALEVLRQAADEDQGHMGWLLAGGERLVFNAMQAVDSEVFRVGDRLDDVLGDDAATAYLKELLGMSSGMLRQQLPQALIADEARMLLSRVLRKRTFEFDLVAEHAAYCHAIAQELCNALEGAGDGEAGFASQLVGRAKAWERKADHLLMEARQRAERQARWRQVVDLLEKCDDVADALEEASFIFSMTLMRPQDALAPAVTDVLRRLADTTLAAVQDQVKAIEIARQVSELGDPADTEQFLQTLWRVLHAEKLCDELSRQARVAIIGAQPATPAALMLASDLANAIETASDGLLAGGHALRQMVLAKAGV